MLILIIGLALFTLTATSAARADGFRNPFQSARANAQGNAFAAQADDPSAIYYNPAAMTELRGLQISGGLSLVNIDTHYRSPTGQTTHNDLGGPFGLPPPAAFFITVTPRDLAAEWFGNLAVGLGVQNLFGFAARYPNNGPLRTAITSAQLPLLDIKPTAAYRISDWLSVGAGLDILTFWSSVFGKAEQKFFSPGLPGIPSGARVKVDGDGTAVGGNASALVTLLRTKSGAPKLNLGLVWRSPSNLPLDGDLRVNGARVASSHSSLHFPDSYTAALAIWPIRDSEHEWKIETDVDYVHWSSFRHFDFHFSNGLILRNPQDWRDSVTVGLGTEYKLLHWEALPAWDLSLRTGYLWAMTPVPDRNFNPAFVDSNVHALSFGVGFTCKPGGKFLGIKDCGELGESSEWKAMAFDIAYQLFLLEPRTITGNPNPAINGRYRSTTQSLTLSFMLAF